MTQERDKVRAHETERKREQKKKTVNQRVQFETSSLSQHTLCEALWSVDTFPQVHVVPMNPQKSIVYSLDCAISSEPLHGWVFCITLCSVS